MSLRVPFLHRRWVDDPRVLTRIAAGGVRRHPIEIESAIYFTCIEALQNATKHAGAQLISIRLHETRRELRFEVSDDGAGITPDHRQGRGLRNMHDRIEAIGGQLTITGTPGRGTRVTGIVELP